MLIVIPVSEADANLIDDFAKVVRFFGPYNKKHELLVVSRPADALHGAKLLTRLSGLFNKESIYFFEKDGLTGWPLGPNHYWAETIRHLQYERKNKLPWLWMELDMTPLKHGWIDALEREYKNCGKPFLGVLQNTTTVTHDGIVIPIAKHLVGAAIYPPDIDPYCNIWKYVPKIATAFDVLCEYDLVPHSHHTPLIQHNFRTQKYRYCPLSDCIRGEDHNNFPSGLRFDKPVDPKAVLLHGCDDGSLAKLLVQK